ncbi:PLP-dependent aminotransferase family protein [Tropicibacter naphthalenivorans]|uniref:Putative HTH-type transcriptional regulator YdcR n=1 Tax=Tropicibacter naphthalenivorans TaxID=441103 RepID=A0A0P1GRQ9_9RHOB|nr:PLP-dependent aminotransferase family protein [Tropicibacter naphthalenivorans]CUH77267.1 putative HTH-type transcriptional regulator YdcR [Tropicibacter naphthalenivorans]SMC59370.1 transcriptional regulator, GntR family [Tropicibacter naphthalenivorans]
MDTISGRFAQIEKGPKYRALAQAIREAIAAEELAPGDKLPPVRELGWTLQMTPGTVARAYAILTDEGALKGEVGRGTFVAEPAPVDSARDLRWAQHNQPQDTDTVSFFSTKLPDAGQVALIHDAYRRMAENPVGALLNYPSAQAYEPARRAVLRWLSDTALGVVSHDDLVLSHGGQSGVSLVMQAVLKGSRPVVLVEELFYPGFRRAAQLLRAQVVSVPMDSQGVIPEALEEIATKHDAQLFCTSAEVHNPTGIFTPHARRQQIADVAARRGFHILEDDCYRLGASRAASYRALLPEQAWYVSSISKALTPALRIGFAVAPQQHSAALRRVAEYGFFGLAHPLAILTQDLLTRDETYEVMDRVRAELSRYIRAAVNGLGGFELSWSDEIPFLWLQLPEGWRAGAFAQAAEAQGVQVRAAEDFALRSGTPPHAVRIGINAQISMRSFEAAIARLRALLDNPPEQIVV